MLLRHGYAMSHFILLLVIRHNLSLITIAFIIDQPVLLLYNIIIFQNVGRLPYEKNHF